VRHLRSSHRLLLLPPFSLSVPAIIRGANKGASSHMCKRSFLTKSVLTKLFAVLRPIRSDEIDTLIDLCVVGYTYQLRAFSELFIICRDSRKKVVNYTIVEVEYIDGFKLVTLTLSRRKHRPYPCRIIRACWCGLDPTFCGACTLEKLVSSSESDSRRIFPKQSSTLIKLLKDAASRVHYDQPVTWHGLRRGRTVDLLRLRDKNGRPVCSLAEVFESGQWREASQSLLSYVESKDVDGERIVMMYADNSDSD